ncbi:hypothetical protein SCHPADRAFT_219156 [Schizopora paradoxa]|uniref:Secreted protein n=1 Tax=Schizopora paradoxa TaxID=27342 RepID=A0A0H2RWM0_9AGAM|nr:hypothetical protein SCHPADRAFT_219156 [Schizopora paradoxa]
MRALGTIFTALISVSLHVGIVCLRNPGQLGRTSAPCNGSSPSNSGKMRPFFRSLQRCNHCICISTGRSEFANQSFPVLPLRPNILSLRAPSQASLKLESSKLSVHVASVPKHSHLTLISRTSEITFCRILHTTRSHMPSRLSSVVCRLSSPVY